MNIDFPFILVCCVLASGLIWLADRIFFGKRPSAKSSEEAAPIPVVLDYAKSFFPVLVVVLLLRSFVFQPFKVPTGSLEPSVMPGDFIAVNMYRYGLRLPVTGQKIMAVDEPKRGDIVLFSWPVNPHATFVKRVVGLPGDTISYVNKVLYINGHVAKQTYISDGISSDTNEGPFWPAKRMREDLTGVSHDVFIVPDSPSMNFHDLKVPPGQYFVMGDNRDKSDDSRFWGFVPEHLIIGKVYRVLFSLNAAKWHVRWDRIGQKL